MITDCIFCLDTLTRGGILREDGEGKHTKVYSTYQQSGNPTGSGIRRLVITYTLMSVNSQEILLRCLSLAVILDRFFSLDSKSGT